MSQNAVLRGNGLCYIYFVVCKGFQFEPVEKFGKTNSVSQQMFLSSENHFNLEKSIFFSFGIKESNNVKLFNMLEYT